MSKEPARSYHMIQFWLNAFKIRDNDGINNEEIDFDKIFDKYGYSSCADAPPCDFYKEIYQFYLNNKPDTDIKVILTIRDENKWYESVMNSLYQHSYHSKCSWRIWFLYNFSPKWKLKNNL